MRTWILLAFALAGCNVGSLPGAAPGTDAATPDLTTVPAPDLAVAPDLSSPFQPLPGVVPIDFVVDDSANQVYAGNDLRWSGSMAFDPVSRIVTQDVGWGQGDYSHFAPLFDDGPWDAGGHEPLGSKAGDHLLGVTVFARPPQVGSVMFEYGLVDLGYVQGFGNGWFWPGDRNGLFAVEAGKFSPIKAAGVTFAKFGTSDVQLTVDTTRLDDCGGRCAWDTRQVAVHCSAWGWAQIPLRSLGAGRFGVTLSDVVGAGHTLARSGLWRHGDAPEFVVVLGARAGVEYADMGGQPLTAGVTAAVGPRGGPYQAVALGRAADLRPTIPVP